MTGIGELRHRVTIQEEVATPDGGGGYALGWADVATLWAKVEPLSARERLFAEKLDGVVTHRVVVRFRDDITAAMRVLYEGRLFNIRGVLETGERERFTEILAEEGVTI